MKRNKDEFCIASLIVRLIISVNSSRICDVLFVNKEEHNCKLETSLGRILAKISIFWVESQQNIWRFCYIKNSQSHILRIFFRIFPLSFVRFKADSIDGNFEDICKITAEFCLSWWKLETLPCWISAEISKS